ncbi:hypothetical protein SAMN05660293_05419 [Dyadobacter psychrophilus]|uniref:Uncharacterized protein n=1 Tax=Dyadobacter psychrophilus TaxID=651661 RepID=A0A1T5HED2_9BACT|nr:hypothetical protein SAMN05660293_05419 [Dyadobacter psychrophilus]
MRKPLLVPIARYAHFLKLLALLQPVLPAQLEKSDMFALS